MKQVMGKKGGGWPRRPRATERPLGGVFVFQDEDGTVRYDVAAAGADFETVCAALVALLTRKDLESVIAEDAA